MKIVHHADEKIYELMQRYKTDMGSVDILKAVKTGIDYEGMEAYVYKQSEFNYTVQYNNEIILYNTLYKSVSIISLEEWDLLCTGELNSLSDWIEQGIVVPKEINERQNYLGAATKLNAYFGKKKMGLVILPTLKCNARCFYCFEHGSNQCELTKERAKEIINFIQKDQEIEQLSITWFGGEPLLQSDMIQYICDWLFIKKIPFKSKMITNGYLFDNDKIISDAKKYWKLTNVQITIDGLEKTYNSRKNYISPCESPFVRVIENVKRLAKHNIYVSIRMNIDKNNVEETLRLSSFLAKEFSDNPYVSAYGEFIRDDPSTNKDILVNAEERIHVMERLIPILVEGNLFDLGNELFSNPKVNSCMYDEENAYLINPDGTLGKCENESGRLDSILGNISDARDILSEKQKKYIRPEECKQCKMYPLCFGGCQYSNQMGLPPCFLKRYSLDVMLKAYIQKY